jgi:MoxR-like ATPase
VLAQLGRIVVGKDDPLRLALACLLARGHLLIEDIPGRRQVDPAQALAQTLGLKYSRIQFTSDLLPPTSSACRSTTSATRLPLPSGADLQLRRACRRDQPRAAKTQSALLEAMEERQVSMDGQTRKLPDPFFVIATQNPDRADRRVSAARVAARPLPDGYRARLSRSGRGARTPHGGRPARTHRRIRAVGRSATLADWQREAADIHVAPALLDYVQALLAASRGHGGNHAGNGSSDAPTRRGLSPRAGLMLLSAARAHAMIGARPMVPAAEDVQAVFASVAGHRLAGGTRAGAVQAQTILRAVPLP